MALFNFDPNDPFKQAQLQPAPQQAQQPQMQSIQPPAYVRQKPSVMGIIADALSGAAGQPGAYAASLRNQNEYAQQVARIQQQQAAEYARQQQLYDYKLAHPDTPDITQRVQALNALKPGLGDTYAQNYAANGGGLGPLITNPVTGQQYSTKPMAPQSPPDEAVARLRANPAEASQFDEIFGPGASAKYIGGQTVAPSGGFPGHQ